MKTTIVGIDCATDVTKIGLALGELDGDKPKLWEVAVGQRGDSMSEMIARWTRGIGGVLLAFDAPLGWPKAMAETLPQHRAGEQLGTTPNDLFRRHTDHKVKEVVGRQPLDVGADRIARTAHAALELLAELRSRTGFPIRLAWRPQLDQVISAIEVYPAATLDVRGMRSSGYKRKSDHKVRDNMINELAEHIQLPPEPEPMIETADAFDAALCVLAAADFLRGWCVPPDDLSLARKEGWIWVMPPMEEEEEEVEEETDSDSQSNDGENAAPDSAADPPADADAAPADADTAPADADADADTAPDSAGSAATDEPE